MARFAADVGTTFQTYVEQFNTHKLSVMAVGKSGVGKSTIGNCLISNDPRANTFKTDNTPTSCTQKPQWEESDDCKYCDAPGIPDTNPNNTKDFYNIIIKEARKELNVIFFVFKYERIDVSIYAKSKMLFHELTKTKALQILVINDMNNYAFCKGPSEAEYQVLVDSIKSCVGLEFTHVICLTASNMSTELASWKKFLRGNKSYASPNLMTFEDLKGYVEKLRKNKNYVEQVYNDASRELKEKMKIMNALEVLSKLATAPLEGAFKVVKFLSFGLIEPPSIYEAISYQFEMARLGVRAAEKNASPVKLEEAKRVLMGACESFEALDKALN